MVAAALLILGQPWTPPNPPIRRPLPCYKGVELRLAKDGLDQRATLINRTDRRLVWRTPIYMLASFAQPIGGGLIVYEKDWPTWKYPSVIFACPAPLPLPARSTHRIGTFSIPVRLNLKRGRYHVWQIAYPAFNTETWLVSNAIVVDAP